MKFLDFLAGPLKALFGEVSGLVDKVHTSGEEKLEAQRKLLELSQAFQLEILKAEQQFAVTQADVVKEEVRAGGIARKWRPILMLTFTYIIFHNFVLAPVFGVPAAAIPDQMWNLLTIGMGGYIGGRTIEKVAPSIAEALSAKNK